MIKTWRRAPEPLKLTLGILVSLLIVDAAFISLHILQVILTDTGYRGFLLHPRLSLERDIGYSEGYEYLKTAAMVAMLLALYVYRRKLAFLSWSLVFAFLLIDNALRLHEDVGALVAANLQMRNTFGLRLQDFGELIVWAFSGAVLLPLVLFSYRDFATRAFTRTLLALCGLLILFGAGVDMLHVLLIERADNFLATLEDGGELLTLSLMVTYIFWTGAKLWGERFPPT